MCDWLGCGCEISSDPTQDTILRCIMEVQTC